MRAKKFPSSISKMSYSSTAPLQPHNIAVVYNFSLLFKKKPFIFILQNSASAITTGPKKAHFTVKQHKPRSLGCALGTISVARW
ncbi:hypothetical protein MIMGU_mgv1a017302mg [Erythranthe guttata]|uniref:Uncharacterized protein n=1 Tax=Erythranthe guttata TaxID=4155 RepID=A0A022S2A5_ERYGU|nr:hypothetical protein MIMGU_mgv1a017302mg [Erythranthe guttata]